MPTVTLAEWKKSSLISQSGFAFQLADRIWDEFVLPGDTDELWKKVAYALAGPPTSIDVKAGYPEPAKEIINEITTKCIDYSKKKYNNAYVAFIFVCGWVSEGENEGNEVVVPLIRIRTSDDHDVTGAFYVDHTGRVYNNWANYLNDNTFNCSWICVPKNGKYTSDEDNFKFYDQTNRGYVLQVTDKASTVTSIVTGISSLVGLGLLVFPPTAPIGATVLTYSAVVGTPAALYGTGRSIGTLVDRVQHDKSINPFHSTEARGCWLVTAASVLSIGSMGAGKYLSTTARAGTIVSAEVRVLCTALNVTNLTVSGLGILNGFYEVIKKGNDTTPLEVIQLTTSIFFFSHSLINFKTASGIIKDAQKGALGEIRETLAPRDQKKFDAMLRGQQEAINPGKVREMHGNAKFIKQMNRIENKAQFFSDFKLVRGTDFRIHKELVIHPRAFMQMNEDYRNKVVTLSKQYRNGDIKQQQFNEKIAPIQKEYRLYTENQIGEAQKRIAPLANQQINQRKIFRNLSRNEQMRLDQVCREAGRDYNPDRMDLGMRLAEKQEIRNVTEFSAVMEYANRTLDAEVKQLRQQNPNQSLPAGIKAKDFYTKQVLDKYKNPSNLEKLNDNFKKVRSGCDPHNEAGAIRFANSMAAANHYDKHNNFPAVDPNNNLSPEKYFEIAREMAGDIGTMKWTQDGMCLCCEINSEVYGAKVIRYDNIADGKTVIATLMEWRKDHWSSLSQRIIDK